MEIKSEISNLASNFLNKNFSIKADYIEIQNTRKDFEGDITIVLFPYLKVINNKDEALRCLFVMLLWYGHRFI